jgi:hypothetical protein
MYSASNPSDRRSHRRGGGNSHRKSGRTHSPADRPGARSRCLTALCPHGLEKLSTAGSARFGSKRGGIQLRLHLDPLQLWHPSSLSARCDVRSAVIAPPEELNAVLALGV